MATDRTVALVMQKDADQEGAGPDDILEIGTIATIHQMMRVPDGSVRLVIQGLERIKLGEFSQEEPFLKATVYAAPELCRYQGCCLRDREGHEASKVVFFGECPSRVRHLILLCWIGEPGA